MPRPLDVAALVATPLLLAGGIAFILTVANLDGTVFDTGVGTWTRLTVGISAAAAAVVTSQLAVRGAWSVWVLRLAIGLRAAALAYLALWCLMLASIWLFARHGVS